MKSLHPSELEFTAVFEDADMRLWFPEEVSDAEDIVAMFTVPAFDAHDSIAQILQRAGFATVAVLNDERTEYFQAKFGYMTGFDRAFHDNPGGRVRGGQAPASGMTAAKVTDLALTELDRLPKGQRFFLWLHHYNPHAPFRKTRFDRWGRTRIDAYD